MIVIPVTSKLNLLYTCIMSITIAAEFKVEAKHTQRLIRWRNTSLPMQHTVNEERFTGLNFHVFRGFQDHRESFLVNIK